MRIVPDNVAVAILSGAYIVFWFAALFVWIIPWINVPLVGLLTMPIWQFILVVTFFSFGIFILALAVITFIICLTHLTY